MDNPISTAATILIASDSVADATKVKDELHSEFDHVYISTQSDKGPGDFVRYRPNVLILAFNSLEKAERYYLELFRLCEAVHQNPLRILILCNRNEIKQVYELCKKEYFDDYVLFWPMTEDSSRLAMSIHHSLHDLAAIKSAGPSKTEIAAQASHLAELGKTLDRQIAQGDHHIEVASQGIVRASKGVSASLDGLTQRFISGALSGTVEVKSADGMENEINRFKRDEIKPHFSAALETTVPLKQWAQELKLKCEPVRKSAEALKAMAERIRPTVLVVDDDESQRVIVDKLLTEENYNLLFARDGFEALNVLRNKHPDLILMDMMMPDMNGVETTRKIKALPEFAGTPVIMITARSEEDVVTDCKKAGATDFLVKPFDHPTLMDKIKHALLAANPP